MLFNSIEFYIFFPLVTIIYFLLPHKYRWLHLLIASCIFYMFFIPIYILILLFTIVIDYFAGIMIEEAQGDKRWRYLLLSLIANIGVLAVFKYYNFFTENVNVLMEMLHISVKPVPYLNIILPIGLSFHTFQAMSYTIEIYLERQKAERHFGIYALYVMFYPQLVAGPIERPQNILHQFYEVHTFDRARATSGLRLMLWGLFKKIVVADRLGLIIDPVYAHPGNYSGLELFIATLFVAFQGYCDFSGYSDIARGSARVMGFELMQNFNLPYFSTSIAEYWRRFHISLFTWFNDYVFKPLSLRLGKYKKKGLVMTVMANFLLSGFWHGASWTFITWGGLLGVGVAYDLLSKKQRKKVAAKFNPTVYLILSNICLLLFLIFTDVFFRAQSMHDAWIVLKGVFTGTEVPYFRYNFDMPTSRIAICMFTLIGFWCLEFIHYRYGLINILNKQPRALRFAVYYVLLFLVILMGGDQQNFIYFQF